MPTHCLFDMCGSLINMESARPDDLRNYVRAMTNFRNNPQAADLENVLPKEWSRLPAHDDVALGLRNLGLRGYKLCAFSNWPERLVDEVSAHNSIKWDAIIPTAELGFFKPHPRAYLNAAEYLGVKPADCVMITANAGFGDIDQAARAGMQTVLINRSLGITLCQLSYCLLFQRFLGKF